MFLVATTTYLDEDEAFETWEVAVLEPAAQNVCVPVFPSLHLLILFNILLGVFMNVSHPLPLLISMSSAREQCSSSIVVVW